MLRFLKDFGAWVALALAMGGGLVAWGKITTQVEAHELRLGKVEPDVQQVKQDNAVLKEAVDDIRETVHEIRDGRHR